MGLDSSQGSKLEKDFENYIGAHQADCWGKGERTDRIFQMERNRVGKGMEVQKSLVGMLFKCEGGGEMDNLGRI